MPYVVKIWKRVLGLQYPKYNTTPVLLTLTPGSIFISGGTCMNEILNEIQLQVVRQGAPEIKPAST